MRKKSLIFISALMLMLTACGQNVSVNVNSETGDKKEEASQVTDEVPEEEESIVPEEAEAEGGEEAEAVVEETEEADKAEDTEEADSGIGARVVRGAAPDRSYRQLP